LGTDDKGRGVGLKNWSRFLLFMHGDFEMFIVLESLDEGQRGRKRWVFKNTYRTSILAILEIGKFYPSAFWKVGDFLVCNRDCTCLFNGTEATKKIPSFFISYWATGMTTE
jgi:hypothetical protein